MAGLFKGDIDKSETARPAGLRQRRAKAAVPAIPLKELTGSSAAETIGNFADLESLLEQLGAPPVFELGNPLPEEKFMLKRRVGDCPASHNRALLDEEAN